MPDQDPILGLPREFADWDAVAAELPRLLVAGIAQKTLAQLAPAPVAELPESALERAMHLLSVFGHACIWEKWRTAQSTTVPRAVAVPWCTVAERLSRPPILSYASHGLYNWRRLDPAGPIAFGNLAVVQNFLGGLDEDTFLLTHIVIEAQAAPIVRAAFLLKTAAQTGDTSLAKKCLDDVATSLDAMTVTMRDLATDCDPSIFYWRIRPYLHGWREPVVYEGVASFEGKPQSFVGASGAQSLILPMIDAVLGVEHGQDELAGYLAALHRYMGREQQALLARVREGQTFYDYVSAHRDQRELVEAFNTALEKMALFRDVHLDFAVNYIARPQKGASDGQGGQGTGGTPFMAYLKKHRDDTLQRRIR